MTRLAAFLELTPVERRLFLTSAGLITLIHVGLRILTFQSLLRILNRFSRPRLNQVETDPAYIGQVVWAIKRAAQNMPGENACLAQALAGWRLLRRGGHPAELRIGVRRDENNQLQAHAWVESGGEIFVGGPESEVRQFTVLPNWAEK